MGMIRITCDSACDLPQDLSRHYQIQQLPLQIILGNEVRQDITEIGQKEIYDYSESTGILPKIIPISKDQYFHCFESLTEEGFEVLHISLSGELSQCYQNACKAAEAFPHVAVVDSGSFSAGAGQLALLAAELVSADYRLDDLKKALNDMKAHLSMSCILKSSAFLHKGGKRGGLTSRSEHFLNLKPEICLKKGILYRKRPFHGDMETAILSYVKRHLAGKQNIQTDRILITYSEVPRGILDKVKILLKQLQPFEQILEVPASSAVSCRCGPGSLGLAFMTK